MGEQKNYANKQNGEHFENQFSENLLNYAERRFGLKSK